MKDREFVPRGLDMSEPRPGLKASRPELYKALVEFLNTASDDEIRDFADRQTAWRSTDDELARREERARANKPTSTYEAE